MPVFALLVLLGTDNVFSQMAETLTGAIGALRGSKHGGANEFSFEVQKRYADVDLSRQRKS